MKKNFRTFKTGIIFGLVLFSMFAVFTPNASAGPFKIKPIITVGFPTQDENVIPNSGVLTVNLSTKFVLGGLGGSFLETGSLLKGTPIQIQLKVENTESFVTASIDQPLAQLRVGQDDTWDSTLKITVTQQAPAFQLGKVRISATAQEQPGLLFSVAGVTAYFDVSFIIGYWPVVKYEYPRGNLLEVGPTDTADFEIDLNNMGNGITYVQINPIEIPAGWSVNIGSSVNLGTPAVVGSSDSSAAVHLVIKPPYGFGFHNEIQTFKVQFTPSYLGKPELVGQTETVTFTVRSVGFSPGAGFEIPMIIIILLVFLIIVYMFIKHKRKK